MDFKTIKDIENLRGKRVLLRLDLNVPIIDGVLLDDFRIKKSMSTLNFLRENGAKTIVISHIESVETKSLKAVYEYLSKFFNILFLKDYFGEETKKAIDGMNEGDFILLENLRIYEGEEKSSEHFARQLASLGEIYVNEAFSVSHRQHASIVGVPKFLPSYAGILFEEEVANLSKAFNPEHPFLFILGGAKFETKMPLIEKFLKLADFVFVGGALANDFFKEKGYETGLSVLSAKKFNLGKMLDSDKLLLPADVVVKNNQGVFIKRPSQVLKEDKILDDGPATISMLEKKLLSSKFVLWNGPLGDYEKGFREGTVELARAIAKSGAKSIIGGGDTLAVVSKMNLENKFSFISTGGGAMLDFLANETLPGIEALEQSSG
ncbi:MAG: Phosphoglycerate kinase [Parcubacteria group bacterium GW2011_GWA1_40_21]|nr:MAG: Phosphoglycerate kinase [Parcubacteria group bacterium GW2011_GWC1_40_13]KKR53615.1 MAG: Phosphoglycerate kinase [Parcubacteria group bacterium GW2011_GWA1_40_21]